MTGDLDWNAEFSQHVRALELRLGVELVFVWKRKSKASHIWTVAVGAVGALFILAIAEIVYFPVFAAWCAALAWMGLMGITTIMPWGFGMPPSVVRAQVERGALEAFVRNEVFATQHRKGVLVYLSEREHLVWVVPDKEAAKAIAPQFWSELGVELASAWQSKQTPGPWMEAWLKRLEAFWEKNGQSGARAPVADELDNRLREDRD